MGDPEILVFEKLKSVYKNTRRFSEVFSSQASQGGAASLWTQPCPSDTPPCALTWVLHGSGSSGGCLGTPPSPGLAALGLREAGRPGTAGSGMSLSLPPTSKPTVCPERACSPSRPGPTPRQQEGWGAVRDTIAWLPSHRTPTLPGACGICHFSCSQNREWKEGRLKRYTQTALSCSDLPGCSCDGWSPSRDLSSRGDPKGMRGATTQKGSRVTDDTAE